MPDSAMTELYGRRVWHVTPASNLDGILERGLLPAIGPRSDALGEKEHAIYCFDSPDDLEEALMNWLGDAFDEDAQLTLLEIDLPEDAIAGEGAGFEVVVLTPVHPGCIVVLTDDLDAFDTSAMRASDGPRVR